jgi:hypothetical protein
VASGHLKDYSVKIKELRARKLVYMEPHLVSQLLSLER